jgi:hypothetical protein
LIGGLGACGEDTADLVQSVAMVRLEVLVELLTGAESGGDDLDGFIEIETGASDR